MNNSPHYIIRLDGTRLYRGAESPRLIEWPGRSAWGRVFDRRKGLLRESRWCAAYRELPVGNPINCRALRLSAATPRHVAPRCIRRCITSWCSAVGGLRLRGCRGSEVNAFRLAIYRKPPPRDSSHNYPRTRGWPAFRRNPRRIRRKPALCAFCASVGGIPSFSPAESYQTNRSRAIPGSPGIRRMLNRSESEFVREAGNAWVCTHAVGESPIRFIAIESRKITSGACGDTAGTLFIG